MDTKVEKPYAFIRWWGQSVAIMHAAFLMGGGWMGEVGVSDLRISHEVT